LPVPSRSIDSTISVSAVFLVTVAVRGMACVMGDAGAS